MHRSVTDQGVEFIKAFEGFLPNRYICPSGFKTIGYGHKIKNYEEFEQITPAEAHELLLQDLVKIERAVLRNIYIPLADYEFDALVSFTFNLGGAALQRSSLRQKLNSGRKEEATEEFGKWVLAGGRRLSGLIQRRQAESILFSYGAYD
jgi:lysozyme